MIFPIKKSVEFLLQGGWDFSLSFLFSLSKTFVFFFHKKCKKTSNADIYFEITKKKKKMLWASV